MWRRSLRRPGWGGLPADSHFSRAWPPFQARVVKPRISVLDRKSTRLNSSHQIISYAVFCLKKKIQLQKKKKENKQDTSLKYTQYQGHDAIAKAGDPEAGQS